jgi:glyoxylase-like metal-dependent hydrolase (beta-lactamase superfamily II)
MYFKQILREDLGCAAYLVGSSEAGVAAVVDPRVDMVEEILGLAESKGMRLTHVIETHTHADHISGHGALAERTGAKVLIHPDAGAEYPYEPLCDGDTVELGEVRLTAMHTPGHRPEHLALAVSDTSRAEEPWLVLTGDSLFIGDVARPDLAVPGEEGAELLYHSLFDRLLKLPDGVEVYPAHVAGSLCGRVTNLKTSSTIGYERRHNRALEPQSVGEFVRYATESLPQRPPNMQAIIAANRSETRERPPEPRALAPEEVARLLDEGCVALDTRSPDAFGAGHVPLSFNVDIAGSQFGNRVGFFLPQDTKLVLVLDTEDDLRQVTDALAAVGYEHVIGFLAGGVDAWRASGLETATLPQVSVEELRERLTSGDPPRVLDVREDSEWEGGHVEGAVHVPYHQLRRGLEGVPEGPLAVVCGGGQRSSIAASVLLRAGRKQVENVAGGMGAWNSRGYDVER